MFYGRPKFTIEHKVRLGLPAKRRLVYSPLLWNKCAKVTSSDVLDRVVDSMPTSKRTEEGSQMREAALHIAKYMFQLQYGLHNVFTSVLNYWDNAGRLREYGSREAEIQVFCLHSVT